MQFQQAQLVHSRKTDESIPLTGRQPKPDEIPAADQLPKEADSVAAHWQVLIRADWAKESKTIGFGALLGTFPAREKCPAGGKAPEGQKSAVSEAET